MSGQCKSLMILSVVALPAFACSGVFAQERIVYKCANAAGVIVFSDKECPGLKSKLNVKTPSDEDHAPHEAEHDAKVQQDKALAESITANRLANEQAGRAAQDQQMQLNRSLADKFEQERSQRNSAVVSSPNVTQSAPTLTAP